MTSSQSNPLISKIEQIIQSKPVAIFMKGMPEAPQCGFSARAIQILTEAGVARDDIAAFNVLSDDDAWGALEEFTKWPTVPQIFIKGKFIGGCDIVTEMYERGELQEILKS